MDGRIPPENHLLYEPFAAFTLLRTVTERPRREADVPADL